MAEPRARPRRGPADVPLIVLTPSTITTDHPDAVMQAIRDLLDEVRHGPARGLMPAAIPVDRAPGRFR